MPTSLNRTLLLQLAGAGALLATAGIHLDLYLTGYRLIPTIGKLFLLQIVAAFAIAGSVLVLRRQLVALAAGMFSVSTLLGYFAFRIWTIFGFHEVSTTAGTVAGIVEGAGFAILVLYAWLLPSRGGRFSGQAFLGSSAVKATFGVTLAGLTAAIVASGISSSPAAATKSPPATGHGRGATVTITMTGFAFSPATLTVAPGTRINVVDKDPVAHTVTATGGAFNTGNVGPGQSVTITAPSKAGSYPYIC
ncbi:MAG TPA: cupredoxin domain-containing protein, partial [Acidimicrobiales bacterium]|nr:cupredoxin domain-containing protein [Acidimicrobiales bacterium]